MQLFFDLFFGFCGWIVLTFLQILFGCLHPTQDPRVIRLKWLGAGLLLTGLFGIAASFGVGRFGFVWFAATFAAAIIALVGAATVGGFIEAAMHDDHDPPVP